MHIGYVSPLMQYKPVRKYLKKYARWQDITPMRDPIHCITDGFRGGQGLIFAGILFL